MNAIVIQNLRKTYGKVTAVDGLNLEIRQGELLSLLGVNGAGKTTTIKILSCLTKPDSGDAEILGNSICENPEGVKAVLGVSPQETAIAPNLTVRENLRFMAGAHGFDRKTAETKTTEMIDKLSLGSVADRRAKTLSGGWQRRLSIAMALVSEPQVLFLDEPTLGLDVLARRELWQMIESLKGRVTMILTTHYLEEAKALSDRIAVMTEGRLRAVGTVEELLQLSGEGNLEEAFIRLAKGGTDVCGG